MPYIQTNCIWIYNYPQEDILKTTVEMDERLLDKARRILGKETIKDTVEESLRRVVRQQALQDLVDSFGKVDLDLTAEKLKRMRRKRIRSASR